MKVYHTETDIENQYANTAKNNGAKAVCINNF